MINKEALRVLPYLKQVPTDERIVPIQYYYDHSSKRWRTWVVPDGTLHELFVDDLLHGMYFSSAPVSSESDYPLPFAEIIFKHFCTGNIVDHMHQASDDLISACGYLEKYFILLNHAQKFKSSSTHAIIQIELEGLFGVHRSYYDVLQEVINEVYKRYSRLKAALPDSFAKIVQQKPEELARKYQFPEPLLQFYQSKKNLFLACRGIRDNVFHHGHSFGTIFEFDDGFAVPIDQRPWRDLSELVRLWPEERVRENKLGSLLVVFALLAEDMFKSMAWLGKAILSSFQEPPKPILEDHVYLRTPLARHLHYLDWYEREQWIKPELVLPKMAEVLQQTDGHGQ